ncbi:LPXTG cell wall anchor domain-containing protein [Lacticaseibacillus parakribbianus]|uniref:LPXTG cell wall anchor domain-containing protein n=1 Tax=Lacticaseibacillus parakribbianus TaxID=2970927 RepID=UPI0021CB3ADD|nr:LPXTG cell wall anchor domain-containing protein [Lacticaseibacillus parakribbianus]
MAHRIWLTLVAVLAAWCLTPARPAKAGSVVLHIGQPGHTVRVYDATKAYWSHHPATPEQQVYWQSRLAARPASGRPAATGTTGADGNLALTLPTDRFGLQAVYQFTVTGGIQTTVGLMPRDTSSLEVWPKALLPGPPTSNTPPPKAPGPPTTPPGGLRLPQTGESVLVGLTLIGGVVLLAVAVAQWRRHRADEAA